MNTTIIIIAIVVCAVLVLLLLSSNKKEKSKKSSDSSSDKPNKASNINKDKTKRDDVFKFMEFDRIQDNMIIQNNGKRYTMAIKCKGINYDLMSEVEQMSVEQGFITFLNTLKYPIQLYVQAQNVDLKHVVKGYKERVEPLREEYAKYNRLYDEKSSIFDVNKEEVNEIDRERTKISNVYEYANDIISYVEHMSVNKSLLQRNFYVLVSYSKADIVAADKFTKEELEEMCYTELSTRCNSIISALASSSVTGSILNSNELADLLYIAYNRDDKSLIGVREALESGFYRLYSTSKDAFQKKDEILQDAIATEAKLKAIMSLEKAYNEKNLKTDSMVELETEQEISKQAVSLLESENLDLNLKQDAIDDIMDDFRKEKKEYEEKIDEELAEKGEEIQKEKKELEEKYHESDLYKINEHKEEVVNLYKEELENEKKELIKTINENTNKKIDINSKKEENDSIV